MPDPESPFDLFTVFGPLPPRGGPVGIDSLKQALVRQKVGGAVAVSTRAIYSDAPAGNREATSEAAAASDDDVTLVAGAVADPHRLGTPDFGNARLVCLLPTAQGWPLPYAPLTALFGGALAGGGSRAVLVEARRPGDATALGALLKEVAWAGGPVLLSGVTAGTLSEALAVAKTNERVGLTTYGMRGMGEVRFAVSQIGAGRICFASGAIGESLGAGLALVKLAGLTPEERNQVLGGNARRILGVSA